MNRLSGPNGQTCQCADGWRGVTREPVEKSSAVPEVADRCKARILRGRADGDPLDQAGERRREGGGTGQHERLGRIIPAEIRQELEARGHKIEVKEDWSEGDVLGICVDLEHGIIKAGADIRGEQSKRMPSYVIGW